MKKRIISLLLAVVLIVSMLPGTIASVAATESTAVLTVEEPWANPGGTVDVNLVIAENPGVLGATLVVSWDENLTLVADASGEAFSHMTYTAPSRYTATGTNFVWFGNEVGKPVDGTVLTLTFEVSESAENNEILPVWVTYMPGDVVDGNDNDVIFSITDGHVRVITYQPGDVNGDARVNSRDLVRLSQYISDGNKTDPEGYNAEVIAEACDVNGDGRVNARDLIRLSQYISDGSQTDPEGYNAALKPAKLPECKHTNMQANAAKEAGCMVEGNNAYWYCDECAKYFSDAEATTEISYADTVIAATGHTIVVDEAVAPSYTQTGLTEGSHCSACGEVIVAQQIVPMLQANYHSVIYRNLQGAESPLITQFAEHEGLAFEDVPDPVRIGYTFLGWYTASEGGAKVDKIEVGTTTNVTVYAHWKKEIYTITYKNAADNDENPIEYSVESNIKLADPKWQGLKFSHWINQNGEIVNTIARGTTGDIELEACWIDIKNYAVPSTGKDPVIVLKPNEEDNVDKNGNPVDMYYIVYEVGTIYNVPMDYISTEYRYDGASEYSQEYSKTLNVGTQSAATATHTVSSSYVQSHTFTNAVENIKEISTTEDEKFTLCPEIEAEGIKIKIFEYENGTSDTEINTRVDHTATEDGYSYGGEVTDEISSTISYYYDVSTTVSETLTLSPDISPAGGYRLAWVSDYKVYAIVVYNAKTGDYGLNIYNSALGTAKRTLYNLLPEYGLDVKIEKYNTLDYELPIMPAEDYTGDASCFAQNIVNASFYIQYDANGGAGKQMPLSVGNADGELTLLKNTYTKTGYHFKGWECTDGTSVQYYTDGATITNPSVNGATLVLKACWEKNTYNIKYNANKPSNASSSVLNVPGNTACTYDTAVTLGSAPSLTGWTFGGWYRDAACTVKVGDAREVKANANLSAELNATVPLYAKWNANTYTVTYNANGGTGTTSKTTHVYDTASSLAANGFSRTGYAFLGWSTSSSAKIHTYEAGQQIKTLATSGTVTLYAVWVKTEFSVSTSGLNKNITNDNNDYVLTISPGMDRETLKAGGYTKLELHFHFKGRGTNPITFNTPRLRIYSYTDTELYNGTHNSFEGAWGAWTWRDVYYTMSMNDVQTDGSFWIKWSTSGGSGSDGWCLDAYTITVTAVKE